MADPPTFTVVCTRGTNVALSGATRRFNICVEHTDYRPLPLQAVARLAAELVDGREPAGETRERNGIRCAISTRDEQA